MRKIQPDLEARIDKVLLEHFNEEFQLAMSQRDGNKLCLLAARAMEFLKIREVGGNNKGKLVGLIQGVIGRFFSSGDGAAWCMSFCQTCVAYAESKLRIKSKVYASESCASVRQKSPVGLIVRSEDSEPGDMWIWIYTAGSRKGLGHTGIFVSWQSKLSAANLIEGNTEAGLVGGKLNRDGGGVYHTLRPYKLEGMKLAMVIRSFEKPKAIA